MNISASILRVGPVELKKAQWKFVAGFFVCMAQVAWAQFPGGSSAATRLPQQPQSPVVSQTQSAGSASLFSGFGGSVPTGQRSVTPLSLTLAESIRRGLLYNTGVLSSEQATRSVAAQRLRVLSALLPQVNGSVTSVVQQTDLAAFGFKFPGLPPVIGPYSYQDARASVTADGLNLSLIRNARSANASLQAAKLSVQDSRELVMQAVANAYLVILADQARLEAVQADVRTAEAEFKIAGDQKNAGTVAGIDVLRAQVELKTEQQRLVLDTSQLARDKLNLARAIGLPTGQEFTIAEQFPYSPLAHPTPEETVQEAFAHRADYRAAEAQVHAAELAQGAAKAERYPSIAVDANYGVLGETFLHSHGTFGVTSSLRFPIFDGGRISGDIEAAGAALKQRRDELGDLRGRIDYEVRTALLNLNAAADQVEVAKSNLDLAAQTLVQARDRFGAGVANNLEVVQAQESVALANDNLINSTYQHNVAKIALARAQGATEAGLKKYLGSK
jgi:outer membrane protein TolC